MARGLAAELGGHERGLPRHRLRVLRGRRRADPAVYAALRYYTAHPEARAELGDDRGVQRLPRRDLR